MLQGGQASLTWKRREVVQMDTYQILSLLFLGGNFLIALLSYIEDRNKKHKNKPTLYLAGRGRFI